LATFCSAELRSGFEVVAARIGLSDAVRLADIVVTGEGRLDDQTFEGKAPAGVARMARALGKPVYAIVGTAEGNAGDLFETVLELAQAPVTAEVGIKEAARLLQERARELAERLSR
jgi:glycerate kinase